MEDLYNYLIKTSTINPNVAVSLAQADASDDTADATATAADIVEGKTAYIATGKVTGTFKGVSTDDATAVASDIKTGKTAYVKGEKITGSFNGVDTSDADATAADIRTGKIAYVKGQKVTGNFAGVDSSDATALVGDIMQGKTAYIGNKKVEGTYVPLDTSDGTAAASDILNGKIAYVNGAKVTGTIASKTAQTYTPGTSAQTIAAGQYLAGAQTITAVPTEEKSATPSTAEQEVVPTAGKFLSKVTVGGDANLVADNIKSGVSIFGVQGTLTSLDTSDADATAENIDSGKTAYVKGQKITGTSTKVNTSDANAVAGDIATGKTAYVNGVKLTGTHTCSPGLDTSDATATEGQILSGKTAYVNGEKVTGILSFGTTLSRQGNLSVSDNNVVTAMTVLDSNFCIYSDNSVPKQAKLTLTASQVAESIGLTADKLVTGNTILGIAGTATMGIDTSDANATAADIATGKTAYVNGQKITGTHACAPTVVTAVYKGKVKDTSDITLQVDYRTAIMQNNFEFEGYTLAEGDVIMFPDNNWVSAVIATGGVEICNHSKSNEYALKGKECYVMSKAQVIQ